MYLVKLFCVLQAQLPQVPSQPVEQLTAEDLPEVPTQEPAGICSNTVSFDVELQI